MSVLSVVGNLLGYLCVGLAGLTVGTFALPIVEGVGAWWRRVKPGKWRYHDICEPRCRMPGSRA